MSENRCPVELWVEKYFGLSPTVNENHPIVTDFGILVDCVNGYHEQNKTPEAGHNNTSSNIMHKVRAKFRCNSVEDFGTNKQAKFSAVYSKTGENADFAKATTFGEMKMNIDSGVPASEFFIPGEEYYLDFIPAKAPEQPEANLPGEE